MSITSCRKLPEIPYVSWRTNLKIEFMTKSVVCFLRYGHIHCFSSPGPSPSPRCLLGEQTSEQSSWSVLRDDYMLGSKLRDWDKGREEEGEAAGEGEDVLDDSDSD